MSEASGKRARQPIELVPEREAPALPGDVVLARDPDGVVDAIAADLLLHAKNCVREFGDFHLAVSGGSTPQPLYRRMMYDPVMRQFPWVRTHLWIVDERRVAFDDSRSNFGMIRELLVSHSDIPPNQVHPVLATEPDADMLYERELRETLQWREKGHDRLDFVLLGMGDDGHTASLFPHSPALHAPEDRLYVVNEGPNVTPPDRLTMTYALLNASRFLAVMVVGTGKRETVARVASGEEGAEVLPVLGVQPVGGTLRWYLDHAACPDSASS